MRCRGYLGLENITVGKDCHLYLGITGSTELANEEGLYKFSSLTVANGGEVTSAADAKDNSLAFDIGDLSITGGGLLHCKRMNIVAGNVTIDDLGILRADLHGPRYHVFLIKAIIIT